MPALWFILFTSYRTKIKIPHCFCKVLEFSKKAAICCLLQFLSLFSLKRRLLLTTTVSRKLIPLQKLYFVRICFERFNESLDKAPKMLTCHTFGACCLKRVVNNRTILLPPNAEFRGNDIYITFVYIMHFWTKEKLFIGSELFINGGMEWRIQRPFVFMGAYICFWWQRPLSD